MMEPIIEICDITKTFGNIDVLKNVSVNWESGMIHGLIGRNGSGKTMLMKCICGFVPISSGSIKVREKLIGTDISIPPNIGIIIETPGFLPNYNAFNNLKFLANISGMKDNEKIKRCLSEVGLDPDSNKHVGKFSLGMRQRLGLAQAIMEDPDLLILDEPMNGLDKEGVAD
ncbi:MAG: ATP-binding cassette domain-containing protein, partial [Huintestinicola sp.]